MIESYKEALVLHIMATVENEGVDFIGDISCGNKPEVRAILMEARAEARRRFQERARRLGEY